MASETRHAAWQDKRNFAVRLLHEEDPPTELAGGFTEFLDAFDFAYEWLSRDDVTRAATANLGIFELRDGAEQKVWAYPPGESDEDQRLVALFGFNPVTWTSPAPQYSAKPRRVPVPRRPPARHPAPVPTTPAAATAPVEHHRPAALAAEPAPRIQIRATAKAAWEDHVSRGFVILVALSFWLAVFLGNAGFLVLLLAAVPGLWWRRAKWAATVADLDDWL